MTESQSTRSILGFRKKSLEAELLKKEPELMGEYIETCNALAAAERSGTKYTVQQMGFTPHRNAIGAMVAYLDKVQEFTDVEIVIDALINGGFAPLDKRRRYNIKDSIRYHTEKSKRLILQDGKLGKAEWDTTSTEKLTEA
jgi:hypothetical protein